MDQVNGTELDLDDSNDTTEMEVSRPAVVDTKGDWTCTDCGTVNSESNDECFECGFAQPKPEDEIVIPDSLKELGATPNTIKALAGGLVEHAANAAGAEAVENPNRKPTDVPLPLDGEGETADTGDGFERFNANKAFSAIHAKNAEVAIQRAKVKSLTDDLNAEKAILKEDEAALGRIISQFGKAREQQNSPQAMLPLNGQPAAVESNCPWERANPGFPCPVCTAAKKAKLNPSADSEVHPEHDKHEDTATAAFDANVITPLIPKLKAKGLAITADELNDLDAEQLQSLIDWTEQSGPVPPAILATAHVAAAPGELAQLCANCEIDLAFSTDEEGFYDEGIRVGLDCSAKIAEAVLDLVEEVVAEETAAAEAPVEAARKPKSHAKKDGKKKRQPEQDRVEQVAAGRQRVNGKPVPKSSAKTAPKRAAKAAKKGRGK